MEKSEQQDDLSDDTSSGSSEDIRGSESSSNSKRKRKDVDSKSNSWSEESDEEYRPTRSRSGYTYRKYQARAGEHKCGECGKSFCKKEILKNHMLVHSDEKPHKCPKCTARFKRKGDYNRHMTMHERTKGRIHTCPTCKITFLRKNEFSRHISTHANLFPYKCKECVDAKFANGRALKKHTGRVNNAQSKCAICAKGFKCRVAFKRHTDAHDADLKEGKCSQCCAELSDKDELKAHIAAQCSVKPFGCRQCGDRFKTKFESVRHEMEHRALKPFRCKKCPQEFRTKAALSHHADSHQQQEEEEVEEDPAKDSNQSRCKEIAACNGDEAVHPDTPPMVVSPSDDIKLNNGKIPNSFQAAFIKDTLKSVSAAADEVSPQMCASDNGAQNGDSRNSDQVSPSAAETRNATEC